MPRNHVKELRKEIEKAVKIRCQYCDIKDSCSVRGEKEAYEDLGVMTYCTLTPNRPNKRKKKK